MRNNKPSSKATIWAPTLMGSMLCQLGLEVGRQLAPVQAAVGVVADVIPVIEAALVARERHTVVGHAKGAAGVAGVDEDVLRPAGAQDALM